MKSLTSMVLLGGVLVVAGCAARKAAPRTAAGIRTTQPATAASQAVQGPADWTLDQIQPAPQLPAPRPTSNPSAPAPLAALDLYAKARAALLDGQRFTAIQLLEQAIGLDPDSFELYSELAKAQLGTAQTNDRSIAALEQAAALRPGDIEVRLQLGRQYLAKSNADKAIEQLRLAALTEGYRRDGGPAALVNLFLARALEQKGYDRAALEQYQLLLDRLTRRDLAIRSMPDLLYLANRPELLFLEVAALYEKRGEHDKAMEAYQSALERDPENPELKAKIIRNLLAMNRRGQAREQALQLLRSGTGTSDALELLRQSYRDDGGEAALGQELLRLHGEHPEEQALLFAAAGVLSEQGRNAEAEALLRQAAKDRPGDLRIVQRLFTFHEQRDDVDGAAKLLIELSAEQPEAVRDLGPMWAELLRPGRRNRLRLASLQKLEVAPAAQSARLFWMSRLAAADQREFVARNLLQQAAEQTPPFAPAYRGLLNQLWARPDLDAPQKRQAADKLVEQAKQAGDSALAGELSGSSFFLQGQFAQAAAALEPSVRQGQASAEARLLYATALRRQGDSGRYEQLLSKLVDDLPGYDEAWESLFQYYAQERGAQSQSLNLLGRWLRENPGSITARIMQASVFIQFKRLDAAESILLTLFKEQPRNPDVLAMLQQLYTQSGRAEQLIGTLEDYRAQHPTNLQVVDRLVDLHMQQNHLPEATRVLDATRAAVKDDPDALYYLAHLYGRIDQKSTTDDLLAEVLRLDPGHVSANNDLGYSLAEQGKQLERAEVMIRLAVDAEPENQSFLDSLGWVLYKRGQFEEARKYLEQAVGTSSQPDPVVLDHMGDALYRLAQPQQAVQRWKQSLERLGQLGSDRDDLKQLQLQLQQKLKQGDQGQPVTVAPVADHAAASSRQSVGGSGQ